MYIFLWKDLQILKGAHNPINLKNMFLYVFVFTFKLEAIYYVPFCRLSNGEQKFWSETYPPHFFTRGLTEEHISTGAS